MQSPPDYEEPPINTDSVNKPYREQRLEQCRSCENYNSTFKTCSLCGCFMPLKSWLKFSVCPAGKW